MTLLQQGTTHRYCDPLLMRAHDFRGFSTASVPNSGIDRGAQCEEFRARIWKSIGRRMHKLAEIQQIHALAARRLVC